MTKVDLITGFLGSGKTTFLLKYARYLMKKGEKIGILEYDYGSVNVDMVLLNKLRCEKCELEMVAAACDEDCLRRRFKTKLIAMAMTGYDRVIIEPSGIFDMDMFYDALREDPLEDMYEIGNVITIVNAKLSDHMSDEENFVLASQAASAGCIVLSRTQLASEDEIKATKTHLYKAADEISVKNFEPKFMERPWDEFTEDDFKIINSSGYKITGYVKKMTAENNSFSSVVIMNPKEGLDWLRERTKQLFASDEYGHIERVKGFIRDGNSNYQVNTTAYEEFIEPSTSGQPILIIIGTDLKEKEIRNLFE